MTLQQTWKKYRGLPNYQHVLQLMIERDIIQLTGEDFHVMDEWDGMLDDIAYEVRKELPRHDVESFRQEEPQEYRESLRLWITALEKNLNSFYTTYVENRQKGLSVGECNVLTAFWEDPEVVEKRIKKLRFSLRMSENKEEMDKNRITPDMVLKAREHPFENLMQFNRQGKALCPFVNEKTPSLSLNKKHNYIKCFGCGAKKDTIDFIMTTKQKSFAEAVRMLQ